MVIKADVSNEDTKKYNGNKSRYLNILKIIKKEYIAQALNEKGYNVDIDKTFYSRICKKT